MKKKIVFLLILVAAVMLLFLPTVTKATTIDSIDISGVVIPNAGEKPDVSHLSLPEGLRIGKEGAENAYWLLAEPDFHELNANERFALGTPYFLFIPYTVEEGYEVTNPSNLKIDGVEVPNDNKGWCELGEIRLVYYASFLVQYDLNGANEGPQSGLVDRYTEVTDVTVTMPPSSMCTAPDGKGFDGWEIDGVRYGPGETITVSRNMNIKFLWQDIGEPQSGEGEEPEPEGEENKAQYVLLSVNKQATAIFMFNEGNNFVFNFDDILELDPAFVEENFGVTQEEFEALKQLCIDNVKGYGDLICLYAITVNGVNGTNFNYSDAMTIRIKMTDAMKKYNTFKLVYLDDANNFKVSEVIEDISVDEENNELVIPLKHLSAYALVGSNVEKTEEGSSENASPKTGDTIAIWISLMAISTIGMIVTFKNFIKNN